MYSSVIGNISCIRNALSRLSSNLTIWRISQGFPAFSFFSIICLYLSMRLDNGIIQYIPVFVSSKFTADQYAVYKWLGRKYSPSPQGGGLFCSEDRQMKKTGFYIIKDKFFVDMPDPYLKGNKAGNRPHYYCFEDTNTGIYWMIPLSSRIDKYKQYFRPNHLYTAYWSAVNFRPDHLYTTYRSVVNFLCISILAGTKRK